MKRWARTFRRTTYPPSRGAFEESVRRVDVSVELKLLVSDSVCRMVLTTALIVVIGHFNRLQKEPCGKVSFHPYDFSSLLQFELLPIYFTWLFKWIIHLGSEIYHFGLNSVHQDIFFKCLTYLMLALK